MSTTTPKPPPPTAAHPLPSSVLAVGDVRIGPETHEEFTVERIDDGGAWMSLGGIAVVAHPITKIAQWKLLRRAEKANAAHPLPAVKCERCEGLGTIMGRTEREWCGACRASGEVAAHPLDALRREAEEASEQQRKCADDPGCDDCHYGHVSGVAAALAHAVEMASGAFAAVERELAKARAQGEALRALVEADSKTDAQALAKAWANARERLRS